MSFAKTSQERLALSLASLAPGAAVPTLEARLSPAIAVPMHLSLDSAPYAVTDGTGDVRFLKMMEDDALGTVDVHAIAHASAQAAGLGIAPEVLGVDEGNAALLYEMLPSDVWSPVMRPRLDDPEARSAVISAKSAFHRSFKLPVSRSPFQTIALYLDAAAKLERGSETVTGNRAYAELSPWMDRFADAFAAAGTDSAPTHGENALSNIFISDANEVRLVDFDRAVNADPLYDLASFCLEVCIDDEDVRRIVALYCGGEDAHALARVRIYMMVDDFVWGLWGLVQHYRTGRGGSVEFYKYAHKRFLRCEYWLMGQDVAEQLRKL